MSIVLAEREAEIMDVLWDLGPASVADVRERLSDDLAYTTVLTILRTLEGKGFVDHETDGKAHRYFAVVKRETAQRSALRAFADKFFKGSTAQLLTHLVEDDKLSAEDVKRLRTLLARRARRSKQ